MNSWNDRRPHRNRRGSSLIIALVLAMVIFPMLLVTLLMVRQSIRSSTWDRTRRTTFEYANSAMMDYMRQFSDWKRYDPALVTRPRLQLGKGFVDYSVVPNDARRSVYVEAVGKIGSGPTSLVRQRMTGLIRFVSPLVSNYFSYYDIADEAPLVWPNATYVGPVYNNGDVKIVGEGIIFQGGPVIITGNLKLVKNVTIQGDLYLGGSVLEQPGQLTVTGRHYNFAPTINLPRIDFNAYASLAFKSYSSFRWLKFNGDGTFQECAEAQSKWDKCATNWSASVAIASTGAVFYANNCNIGVQGTVARPITIVANGPDGSNQKGCVVTPVDILYPGGANYANDNYSIAILAKNTIDSWNLDGGDLTLHGLLYSANGPTPPQHFLHTSGGEKFYLYGSQMAGEIFNNNNEAVYTADPYMAKILPLALESKPQLENWDIR